LNGLVQSTEGFAASGISIDQDKLPPQHAFVPKPVLGRGLGELLNSAKAQEPAAIPKENPPVQDQPGGVETLLRGKKETPSPWNPPASRSTLEVSPARARRLLTISLFLADAGLVAAGAIIAAETSFAAAPGRFSLGLLLVALGAWFGYLAWYHSRKERP
jgi:hypothetical protein